MTLRAVRWMLPSPIVAGPAASSLAEIAPRNSDRRLAAIGADNVSSRASSAGVRRGIEEPPGWVSGADDPSCPSPFKPPWLASTPRCLTEDTQLPERAHAVLVGRKVAPAPRSV